LIAAGEGQKVPASALQVIRDTGASLESAVQKMQSGQPFALDALEKIAWDRTKVDLARVAPENAKLTDRQLADKMYDRRWNENMLQKIRDDIKGFEEIAAKSDEWKAGFQRQSETATLAERAMVKVKQMQHLADMLEEHMLRRQPTPKLGQGPKTRAARRNELVSKDQNALND